MTTRRSCACGCGEPLTGRRPQARYATDACRTRSWKDRRRNAQQAPGKPSRNGKRRRIEVRLSHRRVLALLVDVLRRINVPDADARARRELDAVLTDHQREALRG